MLDDKRFDFSQESDLKERLWKQMLEKSREAAPRREEVKVESLSTAPKIAEKTSENSHEVAHKDMGKSR